MFGSLVQDPDGSGEWIRKEEVRERAVWINATEIITSNDYLVRKLLKRFLELSLL